MAAQIRNFMIDVIILVLHTVLVSHWFITLAAPLISNHLYTSLGDTRSLSVLLVTRTVWNSVFSYIPPNHCTLELSL